MTENTPPAVAAFKSLFSGAKTDISDFLAENVELRPPTYGKSWFGKPLVGRLVTFAADEFGGLNYNRIWRDGHSYVLRFEGAIDGKALSGVDIVELDTEGRIGLIEIFARPPGQMLQFRDRMGLRIKDDAGVSKAMGLS
ncbi:hypothetical protein Sphch_0174 [Sphingobium chlorophenolicum L-1]|uniref:SnoaL-like domain-containing protein n=1 Tax=Sphingobium chlorophenolicum L-1 TaxID=690566 RepID=F6EUI0_SPHCR|nr:hypothetical protein [Sphingobium chlorophenolicum]AEG47874.1 hypothetical protein Sphch_0174 [Sphingobium chlorophenolicum L-1]